MARTVAALALLMASFGCAGRASVGSTGAGGGPSQVDPSAGSPSSAGSPGGAGSPSSAGGPSDAPDCTGSLAELNALTDARCPASWCAAVGWVSGCFGLPADVYQTGSSECSRSRHVELQFTSGETKTCYYFDGAPSIDPALATIELSSPTLSYCNGTATHVASSALPESCPFAPTVRCTGTERHVGAGPAPTCHDAFSGGSCGICCPSDPVDCTNRADGYPNGGCVASDNSFCSCTCQRGQWSCAC